MNPIRNNHGYTLLEMLVSVGVVAIVATCTMAMMVDGMRAVGNRTIQAQQDSDAVMAMQNIVSDVREAKSFSLIANSTRLRLVFPVVTSQGYYNRQQPDTANQIDYYLSDKSGAPGKDGSLLWRGKNNNNRRVVARNIKSLTFEADDAAETRAVKITIIAKDPNSDAKKPATELTERVVYLRNY